MEYTKERTAIIFGQEMKPCPACGSYHLKHQTPIQMDIATEDGAREILRKWAKASKGGATPLLGPVFLMCFGCGHKGPAVDCTGRTSEDVGRDASLNTEVKRLWNEQPFTKEQWIEAAHRFLRESQGAPANETEEKNLREWAASLADGESDYRSDGYNPKDAHDEELSRE